MSFVRKLVLIAVTAFTAQSAVAGLLMKPTSDPDLVYSGTLLEGTYTDSVSKPSVFLGFELINKVPATLHTPLMSGANAISGITVVGAVALAGSGAADLAQWLGAGAVALATVNVVGGYMVTDRMLGFFKKKEG